MKKHKFNRVRRKKEPLDLDITSLLDILTIILVFLLFSYNPSELKIDLVDKLHLAESLTKKITTFAPVIQINNELNIFFNSKLLGSINQMETRETLKSLLKKEKQIIESQRAMGKKNEKDIIVNLVFDKNVKSKHVNLLMHETALSGFSKFKFIVKSK